MRAANQAPKFLRMVKSLQNALIILTAALFFTACTKKQGPTQYGNMTGGDYADSSDIIPDGQTEGDWGDELVERDPNATGWSEDGTMYNGREVVRGLIPSVYFGFDSSAIGASERGKLQQAANHLSQNPSDGLLIEGHCDWHGTTEYNLALGDRRSTSALDYLSTLGIDSSRVELLSKGSLEATSGLSKSDASQDRRADLIILK